MKTENSYQEWGAGIVLERKYSGFNKTHEPKKTEYWPHAVDFFVCVFAELRKDAPKGEINKLRLLSSQCLLSKSQSNKENMPVNQNILKNNWFKLI